MAREANYRPAAPGDGVGSVHLSRQQIEDSVLLEQEARPYAQRFIEEEDTRRFWIGCSCYSTNRALLITIEAARLMCGKVEGTQGIAAKLLQMALAEIGDEIGDDK